MSKEMDRRINEAAEKSGLTFDRVKVSTFNLFSPIVLQKSYKKSKNVQKCHALNKRKIKCDI